MNPIKCPICGSSSLKWDQKGDWTIFICSSCTCRFSVPNNDIRDIKVQPTIIIYNPSRRTQNMRSGSNGKILLIK